MNISPEFVVMRLSIKAFVVVTGFSFGAAFFNFIKGDSEFIHLLAGSISGTVIQIWLYLLLLSIILFWEAIESLLVAFLTIKRLA